MSGNRTQKKTRFTNTRNTSGKRKMKRQKGIFGTYSISSALTAYTENGFSVIRNAQQLFSAMEGVRLNGKLTLQVDCTIHLSQALLPGLLGLGSTRQSIILRPSNPRRIPSKAFDMTVSMIRTEDLG